MLKLKLMCMALAMTATCVAKDVKKVVLKTQPEMVCVNCENKIKDGLRFEKGVSDVVTNLEDKTVTVTYNADKTSEEKIVAALAKVDFKATPANAEEGKKCGKSGGCGKKEGGCGKKEGGCSKKEGGMHKGGGCGKSGGMHKGTSKVQFKAAQMRCGGCARKVKNLLKGIDGVDSVAIDLQTKVVTVEYDKSKTNADAMKEAFKTINYTVEDVAPAKAARKPLPTEPLGKSDKSVKFKASQIRCGGCAGKVKRLMYTLDGVCWVDVDMTTKVVTVDYQSAKTNPAAMKEAFKTINYTVEDVN